MTKVGIVGVGAIGGWLGAGLGALPHIQLSAWARGATLAALQKDGLQLQRAAAPGAAVQTAQVPVIASHDAAVLGVQDLVVLSVKAPALQDVAAQIQPLLGPETMVLCAMNGVPWWFLHGFGGALANQRLHSVDASGLLAKHLPAQHIIGCVVHASCSTSAPGVVQHHFGNGLIIGEPSGASTQRVQSLLALLQEAGFQATLSAQIQRDIWYKLWGNMTMNPISAITGATTDKILDDELVRGFVSQVMLEAKAIGAHIGIPIDQQPEDRHAVTRKLGAFKTSMLQDIEAHKPIELDALVGAVQELGRMAHVATPYTDALLGLSRLHARVRGLY
jgi:2-dehydropantoate 2-reductase